jgi:hypothetical protein
MTDTNEDGDHELGRKLTEAGISWFVCPLCSTISVNPNDVQERYCGRCHRFVDDPPPLPMGSYWHPGDEA